MTFVLLIQLVTLVLVSFLGVFILYKNPRLRAHRYFCLFALSTAGWNASLFIAISEIGQPLLWGRLAFSFGILMSTGVFLFARVFSSSQNDFSLFDRFILLSSVLFAAVSGTTGLIVKYAYVVERTYIRGDFTPFVLLYLVYFFGFLISAFVRLFFAHTRAQGTERLQLTYVITGFLLFFIPFGVTNLILPNVFGIFQYNNLGPSFTLPMVSLIAYAIIRHRFLDIRVVIQRGLIFTVLLALVIGCYLSTAFILGLLFHRSADVAFLVSAGVTAVLGAFGTPFIEKYFRKWTDKIFFKDKYDYSQAIGEISEVLNRSIDLTRISTRLRDELKRIFKIEDVRFALLPQDVELSKDGQWLPFNREYSDNLINEFIKNPETVFVSEIPYLLKEPEIMQEYREFLFELGQFAKVYNFEAITPITLESRITGIVVLGKKLSGDPYTEEDRRFLKTLANQTAVALEKAKLYEQVKDYSKSLEEKVKERTAEIEKLQEEQKQMMVDVSHDLQTPLTIIKAELEMLKMESPSNEKFSRFDRSIDKMSNLIYDLLHLGQLESSTSDFNREQIDLSQLLQEQVEYFQVLAEEKNIRVMSNLQSRIMIMGNKNTLEELVTNLVSNAMKYMREEGERSIYINLAEKNGNAVLSIRDTGIGIIKKELPRIFERFYRVKQGNKKGSGLGLAICKKIVDRHNGKITVESELGRGTTFTVTLPLI